MIRGELLKISRMWLTWIMFVLMAGAMMMLNVLLATTRDLKDGLQKAPLDALYQGMGMNLTVFRVFVGFFLLILTSYVIGQEFQFGTIRVLLSRGAGRVQLLLAKLSALVLVALALVVFALIFDSGMMALSIIYLQGDLNVLQAITPAFWSNSGLYLLTVLVSMGVTILMAVAVNALFRSLALGMSAALAWFAVDNLGLLFLSVASGLTGSHFWLDISAYVLGPNLNVMPRVVLPASLSAVKIGITPLVNVDGPHTLWVALGYAAVFAVAAILLTWMRDVKE
jgi:ABC-type transport system involved in multi-copper enzyme maturation permease subunit